MNDRQLVSRWFMLQIRAKAFALGMDHIGQLTAARMQPSVAVADLELGNAEAHLKPAFDELEESLTALDLRAAAISLNRVQELLIAPVLRFGELKNRVDELRGRIFDGLDEESFLLLPKRDADLYKRSDPLFGQEVDLAFPSSSEEISEAGKCLALGRYTAVVFHLMRAMETALEKIAQHLQATIIDKNGKGLTWLVMSANLKGKIDELPRDDPTKAEWYRVHGFFHSVGLAWRNETMHSKKTYTEEQAKEVFEMTKTFMASAARLF